ncbi:MAG: prephenate dehydratase [Flavobacteriaceae bacterium]
MNKKVPVIGIQGALGSYHHQVARACYGEQATFLECMRFDSLLEALFQEDCDIAVMALENSIAGSILPNYALIDRMGGVIIGEYYLSVQHQIMALPGQSLEAITEVRSHPMALLQCREFLSTYPHIRLVEADDTAAVAAEIQRDKLEHVAAIASTEASQLNQLEILASDIQTIKKNVTRFVIVARENTQENHTFNKASLKITLDHKRGSLATILNVLSDCHMNLTKIQSLPVIETPGKYAFFIDVTFEEPAAFEKAESLLSIMATSLKILGTYSIIHD